MKTYVAAAMILLAGVAPVWSACELSQTIEIEPQPSIDTNPGSDTRPKLAYGLEDGSNVFIGRFFVDADGSPKAYHPDNSLALDYIRNAGTEGDWWGLATDAENCGRTGTPLLQGLFDPEPGYYVSMTSMYNRYLKWCGTPARFVNSEIIPFVALSPAIRKYDYRLNEGALALVVNLRNGRRSFALFADQAPPYGFGEGSIALAKRLGYNPSAKHGGTAKRENLFIVFNNTMAFPKDAAEVDTRAEQAFQTWGGEARLQDCLVELKKPG
jgi:hypothetical protein